jgi:hypothetical protein
VRQQATIVPLELDGSAQQLGGDRGGGPGHDRNLGHTKIGN